MMTATLAGPPAPPLRFETLHAALENAARSDTGLTFCTSREEETFVSFRELRERALHAAGALKERGVARGDRVAIILPTCVEFMDAFFGALFAGAIPVPLYPPVRLGRLDEYHARTASLMTAVGARLLVTETRIWSLLGKVVERARPALGVATDLRSAATLEEPASAEDVALIQFSSGTTVDPKPVVLTHRNVLSNVAAIDSFLPEGGAVRQAGVSWLPLYHDMGLIGCLLSAVIHPGPLALLPPEAFLAKPALWLRAISRHKATISVAPNFAFGLCLKRIRDEELAGVDLSTWKLALNGAEPVSPGVLRRFADRFAPFGFDERALMPVYGLSEASLAVTFSPPGRGFAHTALNGNDVASVGVPVPGVEVRIDGSGPEGASNVGEVLVRGPSVMHGYFGNADATARALEGGWLHTGDLGFIAGGELHLCGRAKDLVILRGRNHAPQEFEDALEGLPGVRAGCSVAVGFVPEGAENEELTMLVETDGPVSEDDVRARVLERTSVRPFGVHLLAPGTLPRTSSGKLRRGEALRQLRAGELAAPREVTALGMAGETARSMLGHLRAHLGK